MQALLIVVCTSDVVTLTSDLELQMWLGHGYMVLCSLVQAIGALSSNSCSLVGDVHPGLSYSTDSGPQYTAPAGWGCLFIV